MHFFFKVSKGTYCVTLIGSKGREQKDALHCKRNVNTALLGPLGEPSGGGAVAQRTRLRRVFKGRFSGQQMSPISRRNPEMYGRDTSKGLVDRRGLKTNSNTGVTSDRDPKTGRGAEDMLQCTHCILRVILTLTSTSAVRGPVQLNTCISLLINCYRPV